MKWIKMWTHRPYAPTILFHALKATVQVFPKRFPSKIVLGASIWENAAEEYVYPEKEFSSTSNALIKWAMEKWEEVNNFFKIALVKAIGMREYSEKYGGRELTEISPGELISFLKENCRQYEDLYSYGTIASLIGYRKDNPLDSKAEGILRKKLAKSPEKFADYYITLTRPPKKLKTQLMEREILLLAMKAKKEGIISREGMIKKYPSQLKNIADKYGWISFDLCMNVGWDLRHYANLVLEKQIANVREELEYIEHYEGRVAEEFERICKELSFTSEERSLFKFIRMLGYYKWAREHEFTEAFYNLAPVQKELGRRCGLEGIEPAYILPHEYHEALKNPEKYQKIAKERIKLGILLVKSEGYEFLTGKDAAEKINGMEFSEEKVETGATELKGMPACAGKAEGTVKIINVAADMHKMRQGDILVSVATTPDLVPALKKAAAIITNEGGITCHAAIISRELKIPCIVGVRNANRILKDGDEIEVDANRGSVRKVEKRQIISGS